MCWLVKCAGRRHLGGRWTSGEQDLTGRKTKRINRIRVAAASLGKHVSVDVHRVFRKKQAVDGDGDERR